MNASCQLCTACGERPKRTKRERDRVRLAGALCVGCHGRKHAGRRRETKRIRRRVRGADPQVRVTAFFRRQLHLTRVRSARARSRRPLEQATARLREAGSHEDAARVLERLRWHVRPVARATGKGRRWLTLACAAADVTVTLAALAELVASCSRCPDCGRQLELVARSVDHVLPLAAGGAHSLSNLWVCCLPCNRRKGGRTASPGLCVTRQSDSPTALQPPSCTRTRDPTGETLTAPRSRTRRHARQSAPPPQCQPHPASLETCRESSTTRDHVARGGTTWREMVRVTAAATIR